MPLPAASDRYVRLDRGQNFGAITASVAAGDLVINAADHAPRTIVPRHEHANAYLCVVAAGRLEVRAQQAMECGVGSLVAYPVGHAHSNRFDDRPGRCINIHLGPTWMEERSTQAWFGHCRTLPLAGGSTALAKLDRALAASDTAAPLAAACAAIELLADAMRATARASRPKWLERVVDIIEADLAHAPALGQLSQQVGMHPAHVARLFRFAFGETIGEYVRRRRVEEADRALVGSDRPLCEIAIASGFADQSHFTRVYRRHFGVSPGVRRRNSRSNPPRLVQDDPSAQH